MTRALLAVMIFLRLLLQSAEAGTVILAWNPNTESDLGGYLLSYGTQSGQYTTTIDVGNVTSYQFLEPDPSIQYYLALRAYNTSGAISPYSNEVVTTPTTRLTITSLSSNRPSPQPVGTAIVFSATTNSGIAPHQFKWWIDNGTTSTIGQEWSTSNMFSWTPTSPSSSYAIRVWARNATSTADAPDNPAAILTMTFNITADVPNQESDPMPSLTSLAPTSAVAGDPAFTLTLRGSNFVSTSQVRWNGSDRPTTFVNRTRLTAAIPTSDIAVAGTAQVTVFNPAPGGGTSTAQTFTIGANASPPSGATNVALNKPATQSSGYNANVAVDGNTNGIFTNGSVTHTGLDGQAWWHVNLQATSTIGTIEVWNRIDCCADRLTDFYVFVSDTPFISTDLAATLNQPGVGAYHITGTAGTPTSIPVNRLGQYVRVQLTGSNYLSLAEVKVMGTSSTPPLPSIATISAAPSSLPAGGTATVSWNNSSPHAFDWFAIFVPGAGDAEYVRPFWLYTATCSQDNANGAVAPSAQGSCTLNLPPEVASGTYHFRLLAGSTATVIATSNTITVTGG